MKAIAVSILAVVLSGLFKRDNASIAAAMILAAGFLIMLLATAMLQPVIDELHRLAETADFHDAYLLPILKCTGIGILTQIAVSFCRDAGESALASVLEVCGSVLAVVLSLPLFTAVLQLIADLMEV